MTSEDLFAVLLRIFGVWLIVAALNELVNAVLASIDMALRSSYGHVELGEAAVRSLIHALIGVALIVLVSRITRLVFSAAR